MHRKRADARAGRDMNEKKASRRSDYDYTLFVPFLVHSTLVQVITGLTRVTTSYRALELELPVSWYGAISSGYALLPIFLALPLGRWIDRGRDAHAIWLGAAFTLTANVGFYFFPIDAWRLLLFTVIGGVGHLCLMAGHQMFALRCSGPISRENVFGTYMVTLALGQMIGPIAIAWMSGDALRPPTDRLFLLALCVAVVTAVLSAAMRPARAEGGKKAGGEPVSLGDLLRVRGLVSVILASVVTVTAMDLIVIYLPLLGAQRGLGAAHVGLLLTTRAVASIASRLFYARLMARLGRVNLTLISMFAGAIGFATMAAPTPLPVMYAAQALMGFGLGLAVVLCLSNVVDLAPVNARATAMTMRLTGNRMGQFAIPLLAGFLGAAGGVGSIMTLTALALGGSALAVRSAYRKRGSGG
jgi:MFS family permease